MNKIAIIAAAGWKGGGWGMDDRVKECPDVFRPLTSCPEPLLPLGDGTTPVSRLVKQLKHHGFKIVIGAGEPGCTYQSFAMFCPGCEIHPRLKVELSRFGQSLDMSPWTPERIAYLRTLGTVHLMPNPGVGNCHDTYCHVIDTGLASWNRLLLLHGDTLFIDKFLDDIFALSWPCQFSMHPVHTMFLLTPEILSAYRNFAEQHRAGWETYREKQVMAMRWPGGIKGARVLATKLGLPAHSMGTIGRQNVEIEWLDIDDPSKYIEARRRIAAGEM